MAQYDKLINLGLLSQFLTKAKTIFAPKITASGILKGDGNGGVSVATAGTDYATPAQVNAKAASTSVPASASVDASTGVMSFKNSDGTQLFTATLPKYNGEVV